MVIQAFATGVSGRLVSAIMRDQQKLQVRPGRPAYENIVRSRHDNARLGCTRHHLAHVLSRALDPKAIYVPWLPCWVGVQVYSTVVIQTFARGVSGRRVSAIMRDQQKLQVRPG